MPAWRNCSTPYFHGRFHFMSVDCFTLIFEFVLTRRVDNVSSLPKTLCTKLNIRQLFGFVEALQMTKVWSCERLQRQCCCSKVLEGLLPVNQAQLHWNYALELWIPQRWAGKCTGLWQVAESFCSSFLVLVRGRVLKLLGSEASQCNVIWHIVLNW